MEPSSPPIGSLDQRRPPMPLTEKRFVLPIEESKSGTKPAFCGKPVHRVTCNYLESIPKEIITFILENLDSQSLASCNLVCKQWHNLTDNDPLWNEAIAREINQYADIVFGKEKITKYLGDIVDAPKLPRNICKIFEEDCPFFAGKKVKETHMFVLVPETVNGEPLTLNFLGELVKNHKEGTKTGYDEDRCWQKVFEEHGNTPVKKARWILITNKVIPDSRHKTYAAQQQMVNKHDHYNVPNVLDTVLTVFLKCVSSGKFLLGKDPETYTRCQEDQALVGGFGLAGLIVFNLNFDDDDLGILACRSWSNVLRPIFQ